MCSVVNKVLDCIRDWSLITGRWGSDVSAIMKAGRKKFPPFKRGRGGAKSFTPSWVVILDFCQKETGVNCKISKLKPN